MSCRHQEYKNIEIHLTKGWKRKQYALGDCVHCPITCLLLSRDTPFSKWRRFECSHVDSIKADNNKMEFKEAPWFNFLDSKPRWKYIWVETDGYCEQCRQTIRLYENIWYNQKIVPTFDTWTIEKMHPARYAHGEGKNKQMNLVLNRLCFQAPKPSYNLSLPHLHIDHPFTFRSYQLPWKARTLVVFPDLDEDLGYWDADNYARELNCHMIVIEYPGFGLCPGKPNEVFIHNYILEFYKHQLATKTDSLLLLGNGWGCYFSCFLAHYLTKRQIFIPMILLNPYPCYSWFFSWMGNILNIKQIAKKIFSDVLYLHGTKNKHVSIEEAKKISELFPYLFKFYLVEGANEDLAHTTTAFYHIKTFLSFHPTSLR